MSRRAFLAGAAGLAAGGTLATVLTRSGLETVERAHAFDPGPARSLSEVEHIVLLMQENRSFDHYFGGRARVVGFADYRERVAAGRLPDAGLFRLQPGAHDDLMFADPDHSWSAAHDMWHGGRIDPSRVRGGTALSRRAASGYYTRADLPVHHALADAFTLCDGYHASVLGPTAPNRLHWMSGTLDGDGRHGGPVVREVASRPPGSLSWRTMPEQLSDGGVSWKVYNAHGPHFDTEISGMLAHFRAYSDPRSELARRGTAPRWHDFVDDVARGTLPSVSWIVPPLSTSEHPSRPPAAGAAGIMAVLRTLLDHPAVWERTALIVSYDENGGFYDHVAPPVPPAGTPDAFVAVDGAPAQPIGLGFRVPCLVISPLTRGGRIATGTFDHTSQLRLIEARFGVPVPNLAPWRRAMTGDMTDLFDAPGRLPPATPLPSERAVDELATRSLGQWRAEQRESAVHADDEAPSHPWWRERGGR